MGDCTNFLKKKIDEAGKSCIHVGGCPPGEPFPYWAVTDRVDFTNPDLFKDPTIVRDRLRDETEVLLKKLKNQNC